MEVQGVGYRPFIYALARALGLAGAVRNTADGVLIEVEGDAVKVEQFRRRLTAEAPPATRVTSVTGRPIPVRGGTDFEIEDSQGGSGRTLISADMGICRECAAELVDPTNRRFRHPLITCTNCGPRFTVVNSAPYDRPATSLASFPMCDQCAAEYAAPENRRFHAQTISCNDCGPSVRLRLGRGMTVDDDDPIGMARRMLADGRTVAVKGTGGYHLACDAENEAAVRRLRERKRRGDKPLAVMVADLATATAIAEVSPAEADLLTDVRHPVVLLRRQANPDLRIADSVASGYPHVGILLA